MAKITARHDLDPHYAEAASEAASEDDPQRLVELSAAMLEHWAVSILGR